MFSASAERIDAIRGEVAGALSQSQWEGGDADDFRWLWNSQLAGSLHGVAGVLREGDTKLRGNAEQQRHASGADNGAGGHKAEFLAGGSGGSRPAVVFDVGAAVAGAAGFAWDRLMNASGIAGVLKDARDGHIPGFKGLAEWVIGLPGHLGKAGAAVRELGGMLAKGALPLSFIPATLGGLETHRKSPEKQTCLVFSFALLALASGPRNLLDETSAVGVMRIFQAWDSVLGQGVELPWRRASG